MHRHYPSEDLVCISVSVDLLENKDAALRFLRTQQATFANYLLDEPASVWQDKWQLNGPPAVFVFDRAGKWVRFDHDDADKLYTYADVEKLVKQLLGR